MNTQNDINDKIIVDNLIHITGWHVMTHLRDLSHWSYYEACGPLDAPEWVAAGSVIKNPSRLYYASQSKTMQRSCHRELCF